MDIYKKGEAVKFKASVVQGLRKSQFSCLVLYSAIQIELNDYSIFCKYSVQDDIRRPNNYCKMSIHMPLYITVTLELLPNRGKHSYKISVQFESKDTSIL